MTAGTPPGTLAIEDLRVAFGDVQAVAGASLALAPGETVGLVGESGSGKSTIAKTLVGLVHPSGGRAVIDGRDIAGLGRGDRTWLRRQVQMIFQDPAASLSPRFTIRRLLAEPLRIHRLPIAAHWPRVVALLRSLGLSEAQLDKYPHQISGGQARRVAIARALVPEPRFLVADEPTAGLDVSVQGELLNLFSDIQARFGLGILMVSHNLQVVGRVTGRVAVMYLGTLVETGPTRAVFAVPRHPYTAALLSATPSIDPARRHAKIILAGEIPSPARPPSGCRFHTRCPKAQPRCSVEVPLLVERAPGVSVACHYPLA
jgi:oligopeptide transport system ATP-binding protein